MESKKKTGIMIMLVLLSACAPAIYAELDRIWSKQYAESTFYFEYMDFEGFACYSWDDYQSKTEVLELGSNRETLITVTRSDYTSGLLLNITYSTTAEGAVITSAGRYVELCYSAGNKFITNVGDSFIIPTDGTPFSIDTNKMVWLDPEPSVGLALRIIFYVDDSGVTETQDGTYSFTVNIGIGSEEGF